MLKIGLLFPGQGAQKVGMGQEFAQHFSEASRIFKEADQVSKFSISGLCFAGPQEELDQTEYAQPALLTTGMAISQVLQVAGIKPVMMAGLSLGEYTALTAAGAIPFEQAVRLVRERGKLMQQSAARPGAMIAINGLEAEIVAAICLETEGEVGIANYNCPGQVVISGEKIAAEQVAKRAREKGARVIPLAVSVPSHSSLMKGAADQLVPLLKDVSWQVPTVPVVSNVNAREHSLKQIVEVLSCQLYKPVLWEQSIRHMLSKVDGLIEIGPGTTLAGIIKRIDRNAYLGSVNNISSLETVLERMKRFD